MFLKRFPKIRANLQKLAFDITSPKFVTKIYFKHQLGYKLNIKAPKTFNEKIQWLKLYYLPENALVTQCADKYHVRHYVERRGGNT